MRLKHYCGGTILPLPSRQHQCDKCGRVGYLAMMTREGDAALAAFPPGRSIPIVSLGDTMGQAVDRLAK